MNAIRILASFCLLLSTLSAAGADDLLLVCAPGFPGTAEDAQPTMDDLAAQLTAASGPDAPLLAARYENRWEQCLTALSEETPTLLLVTAPFHSLASAQFELEILGHAVASVDGSPTGPGRWSLVAKKGSLQTTADLSGWSIQSSAGYAPLYVQEALGGWGSLPQDAAIEFQPRVLSALRAASRGEPVAALLDRSQAAALEKLPFGDQLEVVYVSPPLDRKLVVRPAAAAAAAPSGASWMEALSKLDDLESAQDLLATMEVTRFEPATRE